MNFCLGIISICLTVTALVPLSSPAQQIEQPPDLWLIRSQTITESLVKDAAALTPFDQSVLFARLGEVWWKDNPERARSWMQKAVEGVEYVPNRENAADRSQRLAAARILLSIIAPRDKKLALRLTKVFTLDAERASSAERSMNADALIEEALAVLDSDPQRAAALGAASLSAGRPTLIAALLWKLRSRDPKLADALFRQAVTSVREKYDEDLSFSLMRVAFPTIDEPESKAPTPPDSLRAELLQVVVAYFQHTLATTDGQAAFCSSHSSTIYHIAPLLPQFNRLLPPEQAASMRQWMTGCQPSLPSMTQQRIDDVQRNSSPKTIDEFLDAADKAKGSTSKTVLQASAAQLAVQQKNFDRAISILDNMDDETRKFLNEANGTWKWWRLEWAASSALDHLKRADPPGMQRVMAAVPTDLRPAAQIRLAYGIAPIKEYRSLAIELTESARKGLAASGMPDTEKVIKWYLPLVSLYAKFLPADANDVLKEMVATLNHIEPIKSSGNAASSTTDKSELSSPATFYNIPISMLENNEFALLEVVSSVESPTKRALIRFGLLNSSLERHRAFIATGKKSIETVKEKRN